MGLTNRRSGRLVSVLATSIVALAGCDRSNSVREIPEVSRKALNQRKVDVKPGQSKRSPPGGALNKGRVQGR
jgi:hypothetical protein